MKYLMSAATFTIAVGLAAPVWAANVGIAEQVGSDVQSALGTGTATVGPENLNGVTTSLGFGTNYSPTVIKLGGGVINIVNTTGSTEVLDLAIAGNGYTGSAGAFSTTATVGVTSGTADVTGSFWVDGANVLGASTGTDTPGVDIANFDSGSLTGVQSFSFNGLGFDSVTGPFGMAEQMTLTLSPGASVFVEGAAIQAVPEPSTWAMALGGFGLIGLVTLHRRRQGRYAVV